MVKRKTKKRRRRSEVPLAARERQIMDIVYARGRASAMEVREELPDPPSYSAVRAALRVLEEKGHVRHEKEGPRYVFVPTLPRERAGRSAVERLLTTFFGGCAERAVVAILDLSRGTLSKADYERLKRTIDEASKRGR